MRQLLLPLLACLLLARPAVADEPDGRWYAAQLHAHSTYSDGVHSVADLVRWAKEAGLDALAITDHNTRRHLSDPAFTQEHDLLLIPSYEWTSDGKPDPNLQGHANIWGLTATTPILPPDMRYRKLTRTAEAEGMVVGINHPLEPNYPWPNEDFDDIDAMEVWHWFYGLDEAPGPLPANAHRSHHNWKDLLVRNARAIHLWEKAMREGHHVTPVAVADFHLGLVQQIESPCTLVYSRERSVAGLLAGLKAGHVALAESPHGPRVELWADADGDGRFEAMAGDTVPAGALVEVRVKGAEGLSLSLYDGEGLVEKHPIRVAQYCEVLPAAHAFMWARLDAETFWCPLKAMSGAIYVSAPSGRQIPEPIS